MAGGDLPDWVQASGNPATLLTKVGLVTFGFFCADVSASASLYLRVDMGALNTPIVLQVTWYTDSTFGTVVQQQTFTAVPSSSLATAIVIQTPTYAPFVFITNATGQSVLLTVIESSNVVPAPLVLGGTTPARVFAYNGVFSSGVNVAMPSNDGGPWAYASNASSTCYFATNTAGVFVCTYIDIFGATRLLTLVTLAAAGNAVLTLGLPPGMIGFSFTPTAANAGGGCSLFVTPA